MPITTEGRGKRKLDYERIVEIGRGPDSDGDSDDDAEVEVGADCVTSSSNVTPVPSQPVMNNAAAAVRVQIPDWYRLLKKSNTRGKVGDTSRTNADTSLRNLKSLINAMISPSDSPQAHQKSISGLIDKIHDAMFLSVDGQLLRDHTLLDGAPGDEKTGLQSIFSANPEHFPDYVRLDTEELWHKWANKVFSTDLMHGIKYVGGQANSIMPNAIRADGGCFGNNSLVNGQWWPAQLCLVRDGAHKSSMGGIAGRAGQGAWSCLLGAGNIEGGGHYPDHDDGDIVAYCGTDGSGTQISEFTQRMLETHLNGHVIRLIRSSKCAHSRFRPASGYRYDGLYRIVSYEIIDRKKQRHRFKLVREPGQAPIRYEGTGQRPTRQEHAAWKELVRVKKFIVNDM